MKKVSKILSVLLAAGSIFIACQKQEPLTVEENEQHIRAEPGEQEQMVLGDKIENAYSVANMQKAYESLKEQNTLKN